MGLEQLVLVCKVAVLFKTPRRKNMKAIIVTDENGNVLGTARLNDSESENIEVRAIPLSGQRVYEIDFPTQLQQIESIDELHSALKAHIPN
jgi:hypothetical protein